MTWPPGLSFGLPHVSGEDPLLRSSRRIRLVGAIIQKTSNSIGPASKSGLGEPTFDIGGSAFAASGPPMRRYEHRVLSFQIRTDPRTNVDGPALRATAMRQYAEWLLKPRPMRENTMTNRAISTCLYLLTSTNFHIRTLTIGRDQLGVLLPPPIA